MEEVEKEQDEDRMDIQGSYSSAISEFRNRLVNWLEKEPQVGETLEDFEDRELDALLLKVQKESGSRINID